MRDTHCQSLFFLSSVYLKWPCSRSWPFLSLDVLIWWIKLHSWSQSSSCSHKTRKSFSLISSMLEGECWRDVGTLQFPPFNKNLKSKSDPNYCYCCFELHNYDFSLDYWVEQIYTISYSHDLNFIYPILWHNLFKFINLTGVNYSRDRKKMLLFQFLFHL